MVAVTDLRARWLRETLGSDLDEVLFVDLAELSRNPARIIPAWRQFVDDHAVEGRAVRGVDEPTWSGRRAEDVCEGQLHEALLNVAVEPDTPFWLLCAYDAAQLDEAMIDELYRSHPFVVAEGHYRGSHLYGGRDHVDALWSAELPPVVGRLCELTFTRGNLHDVPAFVAAKSFAGGVSPDRAAELAVVVHALATSSLHRGASAGAVRVWTRDNAVICEIVDPSSISDVLSGRKVTSRDQRNALWSANELGDLVQVRSNAEGTTVRLHSWL